MRIDLRYINETVLVFIVTQMLPLYLYELRSGEVKFPGKEQALFRKKILEESFALVPTKGRGSACAH